MYKKFFTATAVSLFLYQFLAISSALSLTLYVFAPPTFVLMPVTTALYFMANAISVISTGLLMLAMYKIARGSVRDEDYATVAKRLKFFNITSRVWLVAVVTWGISAAVDAFMEGDVIRGVFHLLICIFLVIASNKNNKSTRESAKRWLGEKSLALREKLVKTQESLNGGRMPAPGHA